MDPKARLARGMMKLTPSAIDLKFMRASCRSGRSSVAEPEKEEITDGGLSEGKDKILLARSLNSRGATLSRIGDVSLPAPARSHRGPVGARAGVWAS